jgi:hypothetical protein
VPGQGRGPDTERYRARAAYVQGDGHQGAGVPDSFVAGMDRGWWRAGEGEGEACTQGTGAEMVPGGLEVAPPGFASGGGGAGHPGVCREELGDSQ